MIVEHFDELDSTQTLARERLVTHGRTPRAIVASRQRAGRGTHGRSWHTEPDGAIACTVIWPFARGAAQMQGLSLAVGLTLAVALHPDVRVKWPNDLIQADRKLGGILIELSGSPCTALIGFGINLIQPHGIDPPAIGLDSVRHADRASLLDDLLAALETALPRFEQNGFADFTADWPARDALSGRTVRVDGTYNAIARGVDHLGRLTVETSEGLVSLVAAQVRPIP